MVTVLAGVYSRRAAAVLYGLVPRRRRKGLGRSQFGVMIDASYLTHPALLFLISQTTPLAFELTGRGAR